MKMRYIKYLPGNLALKKSWIVGHYDVVRICQQQSITKKKIGLESVERVGSNISEVSGIG